MLACASRLLPATLALLSLMAASAEAARPRLQITPRNATRDAIVLLDVSGYEPGGTATLRVNGTPKDTFWIPASGTTSVFWQVPSAAPLEGQEIEVCLQCDVEGQEISDTEDIHVGTGTLTANQWNLQVQAVEVTQGVRGAIPTRDVPGGSFLLPNDGVELVANRRTVVRVYPWMDIGPDGTPKNVFAYLWANIDGEIVGPLEKLSYVTPYRSLAGRRGAVAHSIDFELPREWVSLGVGETTKSLAMFVEVNPTSHPSHRPEEADVTDNHAQLPVYALHHVGRSNLFAMDFRPFLLEWREDDDSIKWARPTLFDLQDALEGMRDLLPLGEGIRGIRLSPWRNVDWKGERYDGERDLRDEFLIRTYLPNGTTEGNPLNDFYVFLGSWGCSGHGVYNSSHVVTGNCPRVVAHEVTHAIGIAHAGNGHGEDEGGGYEPLYPGSHGQLEPDTWGFDVDDSIPYSPTREGCFEEVRHDYMSYATTESGSCRSWASRFMWEAVAAGLGQPAISTKDAAPPAKGIPGNETLMLTGWFENGLFDPSPLFPLPSQPASNGQAPFFLMFYDEVGNFLGSGKPGLGILADAGTSNLATGVLDVPPGWTKMVVRIGSDDVQSFPRSANAPTCSWTTQGGFQWGASGTVTLAWTGSDLDGDVLTYRVVGIRDGVDRHVVVPETDQTQAQLELADLPGGGVWELTVEVSDGLRCGSSTAISGVAQPKAPRPFIVFPREGGVYHRDRTLVAEALYADFQDQLDGSGMVWTLDGNGAGTGSSLELPTLSPGVHTLTVQATNTYQVQGTTQVQFEILDQLGSPNLTWPPVGTAGWGGTVSLQWDPVAGATFYDVQVYGDAQHVELLFESTGLTETSVDYNLPYQDEPYYWTVQASDGTTRSTGTSWFAAGAPTAVPELFAGRTLQAFPNPFNPTTTLTFELVSPGRITLDVFDAAGHRVRRLMEGHRSAGQHALEWNGTDARGKPVASGVYHIRLTTPAGSGTLRTALVK